MAKLCTVEGCNGIHVAKGYCGKHYKQITVHGSIIQGYTKNVNRICCVEECTSPAYTKGYCCKHIQQLRNKGKTTNNTNKDLNSVIDKGYYVELILTNQKMEEVGRAKVDKEDLKLVQSYGRWSLGTRGYVINNEYDIAKRKRIKTNRMHRVVMKAQDEELVDHKKAGLKSKSDNRKKNLRICNHSENQYNVKKRSDNKSGYKGVSWNSRYNKWLAQIMVNKKSVYLGIFNTPEEASKAYIKAAKKYHKEFYRKT